MLYTTTKCCRICKSTNLESIFNLGDQALTGVFPKSTSENVPIGPVELVKCSETKGGCGLVQLKQSYSPDAMYGSNYGYRSGLNQSMINHLKKRAQLAMEIAKPEKGDVILDIGSNDCTSLRNYSSDLKLIGMDPSGTKFLKYYPEHVKLIPDFFNAANFRKNMHNEKAKIVTSIAMFYDLEDPIQFMKEIHEILHDDGIWVFEQSYLPTMLEMNAYDTVCHEHISYYAFKQIKWMADRADFKIIDVELNDINGGSFCITVAKKSSKHEENKTRIDELIKSEEELKLSTLTPYHEFLSRVENHKKELNDFIKAETAKGKKIYGYGASTKGNVILQYCNITKNEVKGIAEVNEDKFGAFTPGTLIPIESESTIKSLNPDYLIVLPWHFKAGIIKRETPYIKNGGKFVFPLPKLEIVDKTVLQNVA